MVANVGEKVPCEGDRQPGCPPTDEQWQYNTNVVLSDEGVVCVVFLSFVFSFSSGVWGCVF